MSVLPLEPWRGGRWCEEFWGLASSNTLALHHRFGFCCARYGPRTLLHFPFSPCYRGTTLSVSGLPLSFRVWGRGVVKITHDRRLTILTLLRGTVR